MGKDWELVMYFCTGSSEEVGKFDEPDIKKIMKAWKGMASLVAFNWTTNEVIEYNELGAIHKKKRGSI